MKTHTHTQREDKKCITRFELLLLISMALLPNLAGTHTISLSLSLSLSLFLTSLGYSQWSHRGQYRQIEGGHVWWTCWQEVSQRYRGLRCWYYFFFSFLFLILTLFLICVFLIIFSNSLDLAFWVFLILREGRKPKNI